MAFTPIVTTIGPWTVSQSQVLTPTATYPNSEKSLTVGNFNFPNNWRIAETAPGKTVYQSTTGSGQESPAVLRISIRPVANIYANALTKPAVLASKVGGTQINFLLEQTFTVANSVSGEFGSVPLKFSTTITVPKHASITTELIKRFSVQSIGALFGTDEVAGSLISQVFRGDLTINE